MKNYIFIYITLCFLFVEFVQAQPNLRLSDGVYRIPYENGTEVRVSFDHIDHSPAQGRIDMSGQGGGGPYTIAAAGEGTVRFVVDNNPQNCHDCSCNNYIWIEHPNGEWTKYSHIQTGSATVAVNDYVCSGSALGIESDVGCASGDHLHFEVGVPNNPNNPIQVSGGYILGENKIPVICEITNNYFSSGVTYTAADCLSTTCQDHYTWINRTVGNEDIEITFRELTITAENNVHFNNGSTGLFQAGNRVTLSPGFSANSGSQFVARIEDCNQPPWDRDPVCIPVPQPLSEEDSGSDEQR